MIGLKQGMIELKQGVQVVGRGGVGAHQRGKHEVGLIEDDVSEDQLAVGE
jgi:hypothetical protein